VIIGIIKIKRRQGYRVLITIDRLKVGQ